jgi:hypothetical protein
MKRGNFIHDSMSHKVKDEKMKANITTINKLRKWKLDFPMPIANPLEKHIV